MSSERRYSAQGATTASAPDIERSTLELRGSDRSGNNWPTTDVVTCRVQPWSFQPHIAHLVMNHQRRVPSVSDIRQWTDRIQTLGYGIVRTNALTPAIGRQMECAGYAVMQDLVLLELTSPRTVAAAANRSERLATRHIAAEQIAAVSDVDVAAFGTDWGLAEPAIGDVCAATPRHRLRGAGEPLAAFAVSGRDGRQGFLQRLAVAPIRQRQGLGRALVLDSLEWMTRWRVQRVLVNTAVDNYAALALYQGLGFRRIGERLRVYERSLL
jgi:ribosomal protein S18 acetylase RimI-like enzyme